MSPAPYSPAARPEWVRAANAGLVTPLVEDAARPLDADSLIGEARAVTGLTDLGGDDFREPLALLLRDLEHEARLTLVGRWQTRRYLLRLLRVRLLATEYVRRDPGVVDEVVDRPLFVAGAPRTGTSILHALLAQDPGLRAPEGWELLHPVPPPSPDPAEFAADPRIPIADDELRVFDRVTGRLDAIHVYGARLPKECLSAMSFAFRSQEFPARYHVPGYTAWLLGPDCDMGPAYAWHRLTLQILQRRFGPGRRWVLKTPAHLHSLPELLRTYPDARVAITHRDPLTVLSSVTSLIATLRWVHSDHVDVPALGRYHADLYHADLDGLVDLDLAGALPAGRAHHSHYADFLTDPLPTVRALYTAFGDDLTAGTAGLMRAHLAARPKDKHGSHSYSFDDLGLDRDEQRARFARYREHFRVPGAGA